MKPGNRRFCARCQILPMQIRIGKMRGGVRLSKSSFILKEDFFRFQDVKWWFGGGVID